MARKWSHCFPSPECFVNRVDLERKKKNELGRAWKELYSYLYFLKYEFVSLNIFLSMCIHLWRPMFRNSVRSSFSLFSLELFIFLVRKMIHVLSFQ